MKNFFNNLAIKFQRFMIGRYGPDQLYKGLLWIYLGSVLVTAVIGRFTDRRVYYVLTLLCFGIFIFAMARVFSKNIEKRRAENAKWMKFENSVKKKCRLLKDRWKFRKTHIFKKCPKCGAVLRLKRKKGTHGIICPHCKENFKIKVLF